MSKKPVKALFCQIRNMNPASWSKLAKPVVVVVNLCTTPTKSVLFERLGWVLLKVYMHPFSHCRQWVLYGIACGILMTLAAASLLSDAEAQITRSEPKPMPPQEAYLQPVGGLSYDQLRLFREGEKEFKVPWVVFPLLGGHWGLGPTFIADAC